MYLLECSPLSADSVGATVAAVEVALLVVLLASASRSVGSTRVTGMIRFGPSKTGLMSPSMTATPPMGA